MKMLIILKRALPTQRDSAEGTIIIQERILFRKLGRAKAALWISGLSVSGFAMNIFGSLRPAN